MVMHLSFCFLFFALGASVGSFLNVVVWRLPRGKSLVSPPSHCPRCLHRLAWYDNIPVFGWIALRGRCRYCAGPISARYPIVEFATGALFVFYYLMFFVLHVSPCAPMPVATVDTLLDRVTYQPRLMTNILEHWPMYLLLMFLAASLIAVSLIDAELFIIPLEIPWLMAAVGMLVHATVDGPTMPGAVNLTDSTGISAAMSAGGAVGLLISMGLFHLGLLPQSFPGGEPALEIDDASQAGTPDYTPAQIRAEIGKEILFLLPPLIGSLVLVALVQTIPQFRSLWLGWLKHHWVTGLLGSVLGAMVGGLVIWLARIFGTLMFARVAMGLGDVHLMFGVGAIIGPGPVVIAFFLAPFAGLLVGLYMLITRRRHELPYGPYLSLATLIVILVYCPIVEYLRPGLEGMGLMIRRMIGVN